MSDTLSDKIAALLPEVMKMPKAKQAAISEALERHVEAKRQELAAHRLLLRALQADYTWWRVQGGDVPRPHNGYGGGQFVRVAGCGNLDAVTRARRKYNLRYIYEVKPLDPEPTPEGPTDG